MQSKTNSKSKLHTPKIYLLGAIEKCPDRGKGTRQIIKERFKDVNIEFVDPCELEFNHEDKTISNFVSNPKHSISQCIEYARIVADTDIELLLNCNGVIATIDEMAGPGSASELTLIRQVFGPLAKNWNLDFPVFVYIPPYCDWRKIQAWILSQLDPDMIYYDLETLKNDFEGYFQNLSVQRYDS